MSYQHDAIELLLGFQTQFDLILTRSWFFRFFPVPPANWQSSCLVNRFPVFRMKMIFERLQVCKYAHLRGKMSLDEL
jgi:hypothetical protein